MRAFLFAVMLLASGAAWAQPGPAVVGTAGNPSHVQDTATADTATGVGAPADAAWSSGSGSVIAVLKGIYGQLSSLVTNAAGLATSALQSAGNTTLSAIATNTGAGATAANQATGIGSLSTIATQTTATAGAAGTIADSAWSGSGNSTIVAALKAIWTKVAGTLTISGTVTTTPMTYQGTMALTANTSTGLLTANVTMTFGTLPAAGAFAKLVVIAPQGCAFTVNWDGGSATATSGEQMGVGSNVISDTVNLTGLSNAPTLFSTAGCASPNLVQFHN